MLNVTLERAELLRALTHVQSVVEKRTTIPILMNLLLEAQDESLRLVGTDMDIEIGDSAAAVVNKAGKLTVPAHILFDIVRKLPDGSQVEFAFEHDSNRLMLSSGRAQFALPSLNADDFPLMTAESLAHEFSMDRSELIRLIDRTHFAISTEETRYYLNGIYFHPHEAIEAKDDGNKMLRSVATDGHRLALAECPCPAGADQFEGVIIPRKTVAELRKLLEHYEGDVSVKLSSSKIQFLVGSSVLTSKLIDGNFPDYLRVIPQQNQNIIKLPNAVLAAAVDRVQTISWEKTKSIKFSFTAGNLILTSSHSETGNAEEEVEIDYDGEEITTGFNARYILDVTSRIAGEQIIFKLADGDSPALILDENDPASLYVLMPLKI